MLLWCCTGYEIRHTIDIWIYVFVFFLFDLRGDLAFFSIFSKTTKLLATTTAIFFNQVPFKGVTSDFKFVCLLHFFYKPALDGQIMSRWMVICSGTGYVSKCIVTQSIDCARLTLRHRSGDFDSPLVHLHSQSITILLLLPFAFCLIWTYVLLCTIPFSYLERKGIVLLLEPVTCSLPFRISDKWNIFHIFYPHYWRAYVLARCSFIV